MAVTVISDVTNTNNQKRNEGVTNGNEFIYKVNPTKRIQVTGLATSTGDATVYFSNDPSINTPTGFGSLVASFVGTVTDNVGEDLGDGIEWVGVDVDSGTWNINIKEL